MVENQANGLSAWGDESILISADPPLYLLAASVFEEDVCAAIETLESIKPAGAKKLHWRSMTDKQKAHSIEAISTVGHQTTIVAASPLRGIKQERARRKCLMSMFVKLEEMGVSALYLESRQDALDKRDRDCLIFARRANMVKTIDVKHIKGEDDARLWLPDQILGAYGENLRALDRTHRWSKSWAKVMENVDVLDIKL